MTDEIQKTPVHVDLNALDAKLTAWHTAVQQAAHWKDAENKLRKEIFGECFPHPDEGAKNKIRINHGMALVGDYRLNYRIDQAGLAAGREFIPLDVFADVVKWTPEIRPAKYRALSEETQQLFNDFITITPGTPGLELKPAAKIRW